MVQYMKQLKLNFAIIIGLSAITSLQYILLYSFDDYGSIMLSSALCIGVYLKYKKDAIPSIVIGILPISFLFYLLYYEETLWLSSLAAVAFTGTHLLVLYLMDKTLEMFEIKEVTNPFDQYQITLSIMFAITVVSILSTTIMLLVYGSIDFFLTLQIITLSNLFGVFAFGYPLILALHFDANKLFYKKRNLIHITIYLFVLIVFSYALFGEVIDGVSFSTYGFLFSLFYFFTVYLFEYRMILITSFVYTIMGTIIIRNYLGVANPSEILFIMNVLLTIMVLFTIYTKSIIQQNKKKTIELEEANLKLEEMMDSTIHLINIGEVLSTYTETNEQYLKKLFQVALNIFKNYELASLAINNDGVLQYVDMLNYDIEYYNNLKLSANIFDWDSNKPVLVKEGWEESYKVYGDKFYAALKGTPKIKEVVRFTVYLNNNEQAAFAFAIPKGSSKSFTKQDIANFASFQRLINTFYTVNQLAIKNSNLKDDIVLSLIRTLELFDHYTGGHSEQVAYISKEIATSMGLDDNEIYNIYWAGIVHDIGKVGIDSSIINKPDKLSMEEYDQIKQHPVFGYEILNRIDDLRDIAKLVKHHHEWWNGHGYPDQLKGEEIPLGAQILCVADAVSSMATKRPYTVIRTSQEILDELDLYKSSQFSPVVVDHAVKYIKSGKLDSYFGTK